MNLFQPLASVAVLVLYLSCGVATCRADGGDEPRGPGAQATVERRAAAAGERLRRCAQKGGWIGFYLDRDGHSLPILDPELRVRDEDWLTLRFTDPEEPRLALTVLDIQDGSGSGGARGSPGDCRHCAGGLRELLVRALYGTNRFDIFEKFEALRGHRFERSRRKSRNGIVSDSAPGPRYLVYGTVDEWLLQRHRWGVQPLPGVGIEIREAEVAMTFFLTDALTGQILLVAPERASLTSWIHFFHLGRSEPDLLPTPPASDAVQICMNKAAFRIATFLKKRKWQGEVLKVDGKDVFVNAGSRHGITAGYEFSALAFRGLVREPGDGPVLGEDLKGIGTLRVIAVNPNFSIARAVEGCAGIKAGDRVEPTRGLRVPLPLPDCEVSTEEPALAAPSSPAIGGAGPTGIR